MSLLLLIDGYNVVAPVAPPSRGVSPRSPKSDGGWLQRERMQLVHRLVNHLGESLTTRTCVVFDAANPPRDRSHQFRISGIDVRFAVGYPEADDLLEELIAAHSAPKTLAVVSSDHRVQTAARRRGSASFDAQPWLDDLLDGHVRLSPRAQRSRDERDAHNGDHQDGAGQGGRESPSAKPSGDLDREQVDSWLREFGF